MTPEEKGLNIILHRHKEPELGLQCGRGFTIALWFDGKEVGEITYEPDEEISRRIREAEHAMIDAAAEIVQKGFCERCQQCNCSSAIPSEILKLKEQRG